MLRFTFLLFIYMLVLINPSLAQSDDLNYILDQHAHAMGGVELWRALQTYTLHQHRPNGTKVINYARKPDEFKISSVLNERHRIKSYDGHQGFISINGSYEAMRPGEEIEMHEEPEFYEELLFARQNNHQLNYVGKEEIDNIKCHKIELIKSVVDTQTYWIRADNHLIYMTGEFSEDPAHEGIYYKTKFFDFKTVEGYLFPFRLQLIASDDRKFDLLYDSIEVNKMVDANFFSYLPNNTAGYYKFLKDQHQDMKFECFTFDQETVRYSKTGEIRDTIIWREFVQYPQKFRIDFDPSTRGNYNVWKNDSVFVYKDHQLVRSSKEFQASLLLKIGHFYYTENELLQRLDRLEINHSVFSITEFRGKKTYVIGAEKGDLSVPQVWYDANNHFVVRRINRTKNGKLLDIIYSDHRQINGKWIEGQVDFYIDNGLIQQERYFNIEVGKKIPTEIFE